MTVPDVEAPERHTTPDTEEGEPNLLDLAISDPAECAKRMRKDWDRSWEEIREYNEQWKVNLWRSQGYLGAQLTKVQDRQEAQLPLGSVPSITGLNTAQRLRRRLRSYMFADRAVPECEPTTGDDEDADKAVFSTRVLLDQCSEGKLDLNLLMGDGFDLAGDYGSAFLHFYVEPTGGGSQPLRIKAHPKAQTADNPLLEMEVAAGMVPQVDYVLRYVREDGTLTDEKEPGLQRQWLPKLCADILTGRHVRFLPGTCRDLWEAEGVQVGALISIRELRKAFPDFMEGMTDDEVAELTQDRPSNAKDLLPVEQRRYLNVSGAKEDALAFVLFRYQVSSPAYPKGAYLVAVGKDRIAYPTTEGEGEWWDEEHDEPLDLPLSQIKHYPKHGNPYGVGAMELLGPGNEILGLLLSYMLEHLDRFADRKVFVPITSSIRPEMLDVETKTYIPYGGPNPPVAEQIPDFPKMVTDLYAGMRRELDDESGLQQQAQGTQSPGVHSGKQASIILQQVSVLLSDLREQGERAFVRAWRVMLQLIRARFTIPQLAKFKGDDGIRYEEEWSGSDLLGTADIRIARGSFTQMSPVVKAQTARELYLTDKALTPREYRRVITESLGPTLAMEDDPHLERVKRQLGRWKAGPPASWQPPVPDPQTGQPAPDPVTQGIFAPLPVDNLPEVAALRMDELGRTIASAAFERHPKEWQIPLLQAFEAARQAAGMATMAERQQGAQQAQQQAVQAKTAEEQAKTAGKVEVEQVRAAADLQEAEVRNRGEMLDVEAALATRGVPVGGM